MRSANLSTQQDLEGLPPSVAIHVISTQVAHTSAMCCNPGITVTIVKHFAGMQVAGGGSHPDSWGAFFWHGPADERWPVWHVTRVIVLTCSSQASHDTSLLNCHAPQLAIFHLTLQNFASVISSTRVSDSHFQIDTHDKDLMIQRDNKRLQHD